MPSPALDRTVDHVVQLTSRKESATKNHRVNLPGVAEKLSVVIHLNALAALRAANTRTNRCRVRGIARPWFLHSPCT